MSSHSASQGPRSPIIRVIDCHIARETSGGGYEFLLLRRSEKKIYANTWRMVGGKLEGTETAWQGGLREIAEETGLRPLRLLAVPYVNRFYEWQGDRINDIPVFVAVTPADQDPHLDDEHTHFEWLSLANALDRLPWPGQREGLQAAHDLLLDSSALPGFLEIPL